MRVVILGCGVVGRSLIAPVLAIEGVAALTLADRSFERARQAVAAGAGPHARAATVDAHDPAALQRLFQGNDVVIAAIGPYDHFGAEVLQAAIAAGCHYIDVCDDPEPTLAMLRLHTAAVEAGVTAVIGAGASPGITNLLAAAAIRQLDHADSVLTIWGTAAGSAVEAHVGEAGAAFEHLIAQCCGSIPVFAHGAYGRHAPLQPRHLDYPGFGALATVTVGHPEPVTLPRSFPELRHASTVMNVPHPLVALLRSLAGQVDQGVLSIPQATERLRTLLAPGAPTWAVLRSREGLSALGGLVPALLCPHHSLPHELAALAFGIYEGQPAAVGAMLSGAFPGGMVEATAMTVAITLGLLASGAIGHHGVFAPEAVLPSEAFFDRLAPFLRLPAPHVAPLRITVALGGEPPAPLRLRPPFVPRAARRLGGGSHAV